MPLKSRIKAIVRAIPTALDAAAKETAQSALVVRNGLVPIDTGDLKDSGEVLAGPAKGHYIMQEGAGLPDARARYTEYGTDRAAAQPHMTPAAEAARKELPGNVAKRVKGVL